MGKGGGMHMLLSEKIQTLRKKEGLSQEQLAEKLGVSRQAVSKWESVQSIPEIDKITFPIIKCFFLRMTEWNIILIWPYKALIFKRKR